MFLWNVPPKINVPPVPLKSFLKNVPPEIIVPPVKPCIFVLNVPFLWQFIGGQIKNHLCLGNLTFFFIEFWEIYTTFSYYETEWYPQH